MVIVDVQEYNADIQFQIGQRIQNLRIEKGIAAVDLVEELGIRKNQMSRIENGRANCTLPQLFILIQILGCSADYLLKGEEPLTISWEQADSIQNLLKSFIL